MAPGRNRRGASAIAIGFFRADSSGTYASFSPLEWFSSSRTELCWWGVTGLSGARGTHSPRGDSLSPHASVLVSTNLGSGGEGNTVRTRTRQAGASGWVLADGVRCRECRTHQRHTRPVGRGAGGDLALPQVASEREPGGRGSSRPRQHDLPIRLDSHPTGEVEPGGERCLDHPIAAEGRVEGSVGVVPGQGE